MSHGLPARQQRLSGWGNTPVLECKTYRPEKEKHITSLYTHDEKTLISRGNGMSYGDASLNADGVVMMERLNRLLSFDVNKGILHMQAGVTLAEILEITVPQGWFVPVIPGTKYATIGGCVASNVHGKNHYVHGEIASHIIDIQLRLPNGECVHCSPHQESDIFWATAGGMGLTGTIEEVTLQLMPITSSSLETETTQVDCIEGMMELFEQHHATSDYMVGWIDHFAKGRHLGKGVFEKAIHIDAPGAKPTPMQVLKQRITIPVHIPSFVLNKYTMALYNTVRFSGVEKHPTEYIQDFDNFFHPLDALGHWNRLYGRRGFLQYQCIIPQSSEMTTHTRSLLEMIQKSGLFSFLAVIKYHGAQKGMLSFSMEGVSIALDFPNTKRVRVLLNRLDEFLLTIGGRVYLAKDARLKAGHFEQMYASGLSQWRPIIKALDPAGKCNSTMAERLGLRGEAR